ncbi:MAG: TIGR03790 family protein, partial [Verrucomicrobiota bacterium]|nr:TIGR03790 family protein [Verrucomicrobiota bacterium]
MDAGFQSGNFCTILARACFVFWLGCVAATRGSSAPQVGSQPAARVVILANGNDPDSLRLAAHYAEARGVPADNVIALPMSLGETISWSEFIGQIWQPLQDELVRRGWIDGIATELTDPIGRKKYVINSHRIAYLVVCRGVPLRIAHDPALYANNPPLTDQPEFRTNQAAVDSELSLLAHVGYNINAWLKNPLFANGHPVGLEAASVVKVSRLDGPTLAEAERLVDNALIAERTGLLGRGYVDLKGPHPEGDQWLEKTAAQLAALGFDGDVERSANTMTATARFDAPVLYFGWYAKNLNGPFRLPDFSFPPGAVALHIHSYSAHTLRSPTEGWCGPFVARGVTATLGNVYEPYLQLTLHPDLLLSALMRGWSFGDAAYYAMPTLSWQGVIIGDPLYRPFAVSFDQQWKNRGQLPPELRVYAVLRKMHLLEAEKKFDEAMAVARESMDKSPNLVVGLAL